MPAAQRYPARERFWSHVHYEQMSGCWLWAGPMNAEYGYVGKLLAHRYSYELAGGTIPPGYDLCHACDTPLCVNPAHLWPGTRAQNIQDAVKKGRFVPPVLRGEDSGIAKLTEAKVIAIRADPRPAARIAPDYGVAASTVVAVKSGIAWGHVQANDWHPWDRLFGQHMRRARRTGPNGEKRLKAAARQMGFDAEYLREIEDGARPMMASDLKRYADFLGMSIADAIPLRLRD